MSNGLTSRSRRIISAIKLHFEKTRNFYLNGQRLESHGGVADEGANFSSVPQETGQMGCGLGVERARSREFGLTMA